MSLLVQGERVKRFQRLRQVAHRLTEPPPEQEQTTATLNASKPGWLLLFFDVCCLTGLLGLTLYVSWVYDKLPAGDPVEYHAYAVAFWDVPPFFHAFPKEYPPLSLIPFSFTLWPASSVHFYWVFALWMGVIVCLSYVWFARSLSRNKAIAYACYLLVGATGTLLMRFDVLPALTTLGALILAERKHYRWAYALLAVGVLLKLYPAFLVPVLMAYQWRESAPARVTRSGGREQGWRERLKTLWRGRASDQRERECGNPVPARARRRRRVGRDGIANYRQTARAFWQQGSEMVTGLGVFLGVTLLGFAVPALLNFYGTVSEFKYALSRPIQIESAPASLLWLGSFLGFPVQPNQSFASLNLVGPLDGVIKPISLLALVGGTLLVCWRVFNGKLSLGQAFVALVAVVLVSNKLLSPQYIIWVLPLVAYVEGFDLLWLTICALTTLIFPFMYQTRHPILLVPTNPAFLPTIALRNAFLVAAAVLAVRGQQPRLADPALNVAEEVEIGLAGRARPELLAGRAPVTLEDQSGPEEGRKPLVKTPQ